MSEEKVFNYTMDSEEMELFKLITDSSNDSLTVAELKKQAKTKTSIPTPKPLEDIDWSLLMEVVTDHVKSYFKDDYHEDNDDDYFIYEAAMTCIFGKDIFKELNNLR